MKMTRNEKNVNPKEIKKRKKKSQFVIQKAAHNIRD